jgi:hypothetical protein
LPKTPLWNKSREQAGCKDISSSERLLLADYRPYDVPADLVACLDANKIQRGDNLMHEHGPDELIGPIRGTTAWWRGMAAEPAQEDEGPPAKRKPKKKRADAKPIRTELVARIRKEIADGTYDTQEKWEAALERMLDRLGPDD